MSVDDKEDIEFSFSSELNKSFTDVQNTMQFLGHQFFESVELFCKEIEATKSKKQILLAFEPIFRMLFESNKRGLYSREDFDKLNYHIYDGYYNKYYLARLKTLTGY